MAPDEKKPFTFPYQSLSWHEMVDVLSHILKRVSLLFTVERKSTRESASGRTRNHIHEWFDYIKK
jgi:hypothetical protein